MQELNVMEVNEISGGKGLSPEAGMCCLIGIGIGCILATPAMLVLGAVALGSATGVGVAEALYG